MPKTSTSTGGKVYTGATQKAGLAASKNTQSTTAIKKSGGGSAEIQQLESQILELKHNQDTLEKEREFYFAKLRDIELFIQQKEKNLSEEEKANNPAMQDILKILYASEEEKVTIGENGELQISSGAEGEEKMQE